MNQQEILTKLKGFKGNLQQLLGKGIQKFKSTDETPNEQTESEGSDQFTDDLPLTLSRDPSPCVKYSTTENAEISRYAPKEDARGIDSFG